MSHFVDEPDSPVAGGYQSPGWDVAVHQPSALSRYQFRPVAPLGQEAMALAFADPGLEAELAQQAARSLSRAARHAEFRGGGLVRDVDLPLSQIGGGGVGGVDRHVMSQVSQVSQPVRLIDPVASRVAAVAVRCNAVS